MKFSIEHTIEEAQGSAYIWSPVDEIVAVDPRTVEFHLSYPAAIDLIASASTGSYIFSPTAVGDKGADWFNEGNEAGSGPYTLDTYTAGQQAVLSRFDDYWGGWEPGQFSTVLAKVVIDPSARQQALQSGDADWTFQIPNENLAGLADDPNVTISTTPSFQSRIILLNTVKGPLADTRVRQAVSYAFPYDDVINVEAAGFASKAGGPVPASLLPDSGVTGYVTDLDKARSLLADAGYADGFTMTITTTAGDTLEKNTAALWAAELAKVGITLDIQVTAWPAQWAKAKGDPQQAQDAFSSYWFPAFPTPYDPLYNMFHTSDEPFYNLAYYDNPAFDELIDTADSLMATDRETAMQKFAEAQQIIVDDAPAIFAMDEQNVHQYRSDLKGYVDNPAYPHMVFAYDLSR